MKKVFNEELVRNDERRKVAKEIMSRILFQLPKKRRIENALELNASVQFQNRMKYHNYGYNEAVIEMKQRLEALFIDL